MVRKVLLSVISLGVRERARLRGPGAPDRQYRRVHVRAAGCRAHPSRRRQGADGRGRGSRGGRHLHRGDLARRALPATLAAAGAAYLTYASIIGTEPLFKTGGAAPFDVRDLLGGVALGVVCGVLARLGAWAIGGAKRLAVPIVPRFAGAVAAVIGLALVSNWWFHLPLHLGPSYQVIEWVSSADRSVALLVGLFVVRAASTWLSIAGGGVGGLFIPLVTQGAVLGALVQHMAPASNPALFPTVGIAGRPRPPGLSRRPARRRPGRRVLLPGAWCPICNTELTGLQQALPAITDLGASLVAVSPQAPDASQSFVQRRLGLGFDVLSDLDQSVIRAYRLLFAFDHDLRPLYRSFNMALDEHNADGSWNLSVPATFVIDPAGIVRARHVDPNYRERMAVVDILDALTRLRNTGEQ